METIPKKSCQKIGFIRKTHGVNGKLVLEFENRFEESVAEADRFFLKIDGLLVPFFSEKNETRFKSGQTALLKLLWVETEKYARRLVDKTVYMFKNELIVEEYETEEIEEDFLGFEILDENSTKAGVITAVDNYSGNIVLTVEKDGSEFLVSYNDDLLLGIDEKSKIIRLQLPEGFNT